MDSSGDEQQLYGLPLDQFTPARDALAKRLRGAGERERAEQIKRLRKPTVAAWALNQVRLREPERVDELLAAGAALREAQQQLLAGGEREALRDAAARERRVAEQLVERAQRLAADAGHPPTAALAGKLASTVHAAAGDDEARELLSAGRLVTDYEISDLGLSLAGVGVGGAAPKPAPAKRKDDERLRRAQKAFAEAQQAAAAAAKTAERSRREADTARRRADQAGADADRAAERARDLERQLRELERGRP